MFGGGGPEENQRCLARSEEAIIGHSDKIESASPNIVGNVKSIGKKDSSECRGSVFAASLGSPTYPHSTFQDTFPVQSMSLLTLYSLKI